VTLVLERQDDKLSVEVTPITIAAGAELIARQDDR
jgi:hypothetical protein